MVITLGGACTTGHTNHIDIIEHGIRAWKIQEIWPPLVVNLRLTPPGAHMYIEAFVIQPCFVLVLKSVDFASTLRAWI